MTSGISGAMRIGLDIGGTKTEIVVIDEAGDVRTRVRQPTEPGADAVVTSVVQGVRRAQQELAMAPDQLVSVGIGIPGIVDVDTGKLLHAVNLDVGSLDLARIAEAELGVPVRVENDVNAAAVGADALLGDGTSMAYLNLGTGVAAGIIVDGALWRGRRGAAGEIGHIVVAPEGRLCSCGQRGCIESLCGGGALGRVWGRESDLPVRDIFAAAENGDPLAMELREGLSRGVAAAVRVLILTTDVERVVLGGGLTGLGERLEHDVREQLYADAEGSAFLESLGVSERIEFLPPGSPVAALGAALIGDSPITKEKTVNG